MNQLVFGTNGELVLPHITNLDEEIEQIGIESNMTKMITEITAYRICKIHELGLWKEKYSSFDDFIGYLDENMRISRQYVYKRLRAYRALQYAGYTELEAVDAMANNSSSIQTAISQLGQWNQKEPLLTFPVPDDVTGNQAVRDIIEHIKEMPVKEVDKYIKEQYTIQPHVSFDTIDTRITVQFTLHEIGTDGVTAIADSGTINFFPDRDVPDEILPLIRKQIKKQ